VISISKTYSFDAAHRLYIPEIDEAANVELFGKCYNPHGHTYSLEVHVQGEVSPVTGMVLNYHDIDKVVKPYLETVDHQDLNEVFADILTTAENIVSRMAQHLLDKFDNLYPWATLEQLTLSETPKTSATWVNIEAV